MSAHPFSAGSRAVRAAACLLVAATAGCTAMPAETLSMLSPQDPKWSSPECEKVRAEAAAYHEMKLSWAVGALAGPYGLGIVAAGKQHQELQRKLYARDLRLACSSDPLPPELQGLDPNARRQVMQPATGAG